jgi:hypothetical protein
MCGLHNDYVLNSNTNTNTKPEENNNNSYYRNFKQSIKSKDTPATYNYQLKMFMKYKQFTDFSQLIEGRSDKEIENLLLDCSVKFFEFLIKFGVPFLC